MDPLTKIHLRDVLQERIQQEADRAILDFRLKNEDAFVAAGVVDMEWTFDFKMTVSDPKPLKTAN